MAVHERSATERVQEARERYVARGISTPPLVVERAEGARVWDADGREYVDFAGGLGCANLGHGLPAAVAAIHEQVDRYLHQCFMVGMYEPYVEVCRRLAELSPCRGSDQKSILVGSGAEAVENAVKIARVATRRPAVVVFENAFHGRTTLTMSMTAKVVPYKAGFGPFAPEVYRSPTTIEGLLTLFKQGVEPAAVACVVLEPVQGEGGFIPMEPDFVRALRELCDEHGIVYVDDEVQAGCGRTGPVWAIEHYGVEPDLMVSGKSLGGGLPLAAVTGRAEIVDAVPPGGLGGTFGGNPVACAAACAFLDAVAAPEFRPRAGEIGERIAQRMETLAQPGDEVRGLGPMQAIEFAEHSAELTARITASARERGLILLSCGTYGNVIRILVPLVISDAELERGLDILEEAVGDARGS